jgi:hypothetical protein
MYQGVQCVYPARSKSKRYEGKEPDESYATNRLEYAVWFHAIQSKQRTKAKLAGIMERMGHGRAPGALLIFSPVILCSA